MKTSLTRITIIILTAAMALLLALAIPAYAIRGGHAISGGGHGLASGGASFTRPGWHGGGIYHGGVTPDHDSVRPGWHGGGVQWQPGWDGRYAWGDRRGSQWTGNRGGSWDGVGYGDCYMQCIYQGYGPTDCLQTCPL